MNFIADMNTEDIAATLKAMRLQEERGYKCQDYLSCSARAKNTKTTNLKRPAPVSPVDAECRFKMAEWCYQVTDFCKFSRETVAISMSYLDRYLSTDAGSGAIDDRKVFQLAAMTCLYTAIKIHEPEAMEPRVVSQLSRGTYTAQEIEDMEFKILNAIEWRMNPPTALSFINSFFALLPEGIISQNERDTVYELAKFQTELAVNEYSLVTVSASTIAYGAVLNALETVACAGTTLELTGMLASVACIDMQSPLIYATQDKLYQAASGVSATGPAAIHISKAPEQKRFMGRRGSIHISPRSVVSS